MGRRHNNVLPVTSRANDIFPAGVGFNDGAHGARTNRPKLGEPALGDHVLEVGARSRDDAVIAVELPIGELEAVVGARVEPAAIVLLGTVTQDSKLPVSTARARPVAEMGTSTRNRFARGIEGQNPRRRRFKGRMAPTRRAIPRMCMPLTAA